MKRFILLAFAVLVIAGTIFALPNWNNEDGAKLLYGYFIDFMNSQNLGTTNMPLEDGQKAYQNLFIDFLTWADSTAGISITADTLYVYVIADTAKNSIATYNEEYFAQADHNFIFPIEFYYNDGIGFNFVDSTATAGDIVYFNVAAAGNNGVLQGRAIASGNGTVYAGSVWANIPGGYGTTPTRIGTTDTPYTMKLTDNTLYVDSSGGAITIIIPSDIIALDGIEFTVMDIGYSANTNNITVQTEGTEKIYNSASDYVISGAGDSFTFKTDGENVHIK
jgi:hypothetical protein